MSKEIKSASDFDALVEASDIKPVFLKCYMNGCPHCEHMVDAWNEMAKKVKDKGLNVQVAEIEQGVISSIKSKHADLLHVDGFPTLLCISDKGKKNVKHDGERTAEALLEFIEKQATKQSGGKGKLQHRKTRRHRRVVTHRRRKLQHRTKRHGAKHGSKKH